jgi:hypothetical protein
VLFTVWFGVGSAIILVVALICGVVGRHLKESRSERRSEDDEARELIIHNAERAGWGEPERPLFSRRKRSN